MFPFEVIETADLSSRELNSLMLRCQEKCVWEERGGGGGGMERENVFHAVSAQVLGWGCPGGKRELVTDREK